MKKPLSVSLALLVIFMACSALTNPGARDDKGSQTKESFDFERIKEWVKDKRIVALGESTHGIGEFFSLKSDLIQRLHKELDFEIIAIEGGFGDVNLTWLNHEKLSDKEMRDKSLFGNFRTKEIAPLFEYIKSAAQTERPLIFAGFDPQASGTLYGQYLDTLSSFLDLPWDLNEEFSFYAKMYQATFETDSTNFSSYKKRYLTALSNLREGIEENKAKIQGGLNISDRELRILLKTLELQYDAVNYAFEDRMNEEYIPKGIRLRDEIMAQNISWIIDSLYPDKKIIIWGHNGHIQSGPFNSLQTKWMGQHLKEKYGDDYFSIGLFAYKGQVYQHWNKESVDFENEDPDFIEKIMSKGSLKYAYQNMSNTNQGDWITQKVRAFEPENNGYVSFVPAERFDAAICILEGSTPSFE